MVLSRYHDQELDDNTLEAVKMTIGETSDNKTKSLNRLRGKLQGVSGLKSRLEDDFLLRFLRVAKFDVNKAFERVCKYYLSRKKYPHIFDTLYPSAVATALPARHFYASPKRADDHSVVVIHKRGLFNPSTMIYEEMFILDLLVLELLADNSLTQMCGLTIIMDFSGFGFQHFMADSLSRICTSVDCFQNSFPLRFRNIHIINAPSLFSVIYNLTCPFLTKKIRNRLRVHNSIDKLRASLSPELLPEQYGGKIPDSDLVDLVEEVINKENYYKNQLQYGYKI